MSNLSDHGLSQVVHYNVSVHTGRQVEHALKGLTLLYLYARLPNVRQSCEFPWPAVPLLRPSPILKFPMTALSLHRKMPCLGKRCRFCHLTMMLALPFRLLYPAQVLRPKRVELYSWLADPYPDPRLCTAMHHLAALFHRPIVGK